MSFFRTLLIDRSPKYKAGWVALLMALLVALFTFEKSKSENTVDGNYSERQAQWKDLSAEKNTLHLYWLRTLNPIVKKTEGDLIWNTKKQTGFMRFTNLPVLKNEQFYKLWIYDLHLSTNTPVAAGTFGGSRRKQKEIYTSITPEQIIKAPFKFLLTIGNKNDKTFRQSQSLFLAQP